MSVMALVEGAVLPGDEVPGRLEIRLFGAMEVSLGSRPLPKLRSRKGLWLLALLALRGGGDVERDWLAGTLWPDHDPLAGRRSLRQSLHDLRLALGPEAGRLGGESSRTLRLDVAGAVVDALAFDAALARRDLASLEAAVRLYRGPFLEDCAADWCLEVRRQREQAYVGALERLATAATERGEPATAASTLRLAVGVDPYREDLQRALMEALAAGGSPAGALLVYRQYGTLLQREMTAEPADETTRLFRQIRDATRARPGPPILERRGPAPPRFRTGTPPGNVPRPLSAFVGRDRELAEVAARVAGARLVTLTGTGGIGKTRLAIRVAEESAAAYADGAWFVDLGALGDAALVPQTVAHALRLREAGGRPLAETLREALRPRHLLLILDNCEHLVDACARLAEALLSSCPRLRVLATSRQPLGVAGEVPWPVPPLSLPVPGQREEGSPGQETLMESEAIQLLVDRATAAAAGFALDERNAAAAAQVCRRLDGIPLAIELAAARLRVLSLEQIAIRLDDRFALLTGGSRTALPRQQTLRATLDWSWDLLSEPERALLRRLSVFAGGWTLEAAEAVAGEEWKNGGQVLDLLTALVDRSLVAVERRAGVARCFLLETTREYARDRLREAGEEEERQARHARFFLALAEQAAPELRGAAQAEWLQRLEEEHDNLRAALDWTASRVDSSELIVDSSGPIGPRTINDQPSTINCREAALRLGGALGWFWWMRGHFSEGRERLQALLARSGYRIGAGEPDGEPGRTETPVRLDLQRAQARALSAAGMLADEQSDYAAARALLQESLQLCQEVGDLEGAAMALNHLGGQAAQARDFAAAQARYEESLAIWRRRGDQWWTAALLTNLGRVALRRHDHATARQLVESGLAIQRQLQDRRAVARSLTMLGNIAARLDDDETAYALYEESLSLARELGAKGVVEETLRVLGNMARERGDHAAAVVFHEERLAIAREVGSTWGVAESLYYLGLLARDGGDRNQAATLWSESLAVSQRLDESEGLAQCLEGFASLAAPPGEPGPAAPGNETGGATEASAGTGPARQAARLLGAAAGLRERAGAPVSPQRRPEYDRQLAAARAMLAPAAFAVAWAEGQAMTLEEVIASLATGP